MDAVGKDFLDYGVIGIFLLLLLTGQIVVKAVYDREIQREKEFANKVENLLTDQLNDTLRTLELVRKDREKWQEIADLQSKLLEKQHESVIANTGRARHGSTS